MRNKKYSKEFRNFKKAFPRVFKEARLNIGYSQEYLGKRLGISTVAICHYEKGVSLPGLETLFKISHVLGIFSINFSCK
ncbi:helix-turn-helix domain-containing protein [Candidatus Woesearchaeota archaeon]|nr:helix-turn-helix domain-containing protein [Candidatus Woesearchaeota archaeon]